MQRFERLPRRFQLQKVWSTMVSITTLAAAQVMKSGLLVNRETQAATVREVAKSGHLIYKLSRSAEIYWSSRVSDVRRTESAVAMS
jgi:hypothetical protein